MGNVSSGLFPDSEIPLSSPPFPRDTTTSAAYPPVMCSQGQYAATELGKAACSPPHQRLVSITAHLHRSKVKLTMSSRLACGSRSTTGFTACCVAKTTFRRPSAFPILSAPASRWSSRIRTPPVAFSGISGPNLFFARPKHRAAANRCGGTSTSCCWTCNVLPLTGTPTPSSNSTN